MELPTERGNTRLVADGARVRTCAALAALLATLPAGACRDAADVPRTYAALSTPASELPRSVPGADAARGATALDAYGCGTCHVIPGLRSASGVVGPPLTGYADRIYVAGVLPNTPANLVRWIRRPQEISPGTAMPNVGVSERDSRDMAAYLYTLSDPSEADGWGAWRASLRRWW